MKVKSTKRISKWERLGWIFVILSGLTILVGVTFIAYAIYNCTTTGCESTPDYEGKPQAVTRAVKYAKKVCKKSYDTKNCDALISTHDSLYVCGSFGGMCGWIIGINSPEHSDFIYKSTASLEQGFMTGYSVVQFSEDDSTNSRKAADIINKMCKSYEPSRKLNCFKDQFGLESAVIHWYEDSDVGSITEYVDPYSFNLEISRKGVILDANITNFEDESEKILYKYPAIRRYLLKDRSI
ncbi:TPA: hypothetical protein DIV49_01020 [Candidatus Saccharibacteria bacterium]|nr:hypothetical protein [Candidatus Saccharibacteria bacterium]HRJ91179.1 hypothetical protein [Candidatus Saccharibacteria bacterium]